jgi:DNA-binding GntR family transcriptional regulator
LPAPHLFIQRHGDEAIAKAREMVKEMRREADHDGADKWLRIIVAIRDDNVI